MCRTFELKLDGYAQNSREYAGTALVVIVNYT